MREWIFGPALLGLALTLGVPGGLARGAEVDTARIEKLIEQLGSEDFAERQKANAALEAIGAPALEALKKAMKSSDAEVRKRAGTLAAGIEKRAENATHLAPKMVHLICKDTPVQDALADLRKQSGYNLVINDPENKLKDVKVTLDTGKVTFWKALELFSAKAGLEEYNPSLARFAPPPAGVPLPPIGAPGILPAVPPGAVPAPRIKAVPLPAGVGAVPGALGVVIKVEVKAVPGAPGAAPGAVPAVPVAPGMPAIAVVRPIGPIGMPVMAPNVPGQITLIPAVKPRSEPSDTRSSVRVRAITEPKVFPPTSDKEIAFALEITPEPKIQWQRLISLNVDKVVDDNGQNLKPNMEPAAVPGIAPGIGIAPGAGAGVARPAIRIARPISYSGNSFLQAVRLEKGEKASKSIKELKGTISAEVLSAAQPMLEVENILKAAGKEVAGKEDGKIKVIAVEKSGEQTVIRFEFEQPTGVYADNVNSLITVPLVAPVGPVIGPVPVPLPAPVPAPGAVPVPPPAPAGKVLPGRVRPAGGAVGAAVMPGGFRTIYVSSQGFTLKDEKDNVLPAQVQRTFRAGAGKVTMEYQIVYTPQKDAGTPTKLVFSGRKLVALTIPFTLENINLP